MSAAQGEEEAPSISNYGDCATMGVDFDGDSQILTPDEMTAMMDKALYEALSRFDRCQTSSNSNGGGTGSGASSSASAGQAGDGESENSETGTEDSTASSTVSGTEAPPATAENTKKIAKSTTSKADSKVSLGNGKLPEDIQSSDNDSVFQAQVREAAMAEKDPEQKAALWEEYRKLKGLPSAKEKKNEE